MDTQFPNIYILPLFRRTQELDSIPKWPCIQAVTGTRLAFLQQDGCIRWPSGAIPGPAWKGQKYLDNLLHWDCSYCSLLPSILNTEQWTRNTVHSEIISSMRHLLLQWLKISMQSYEWVVYNSWSKNGTTNRKLLLGSLLRIHFLSPLKILAFSFKLSFSCKSHIWAPRSLCKFPQSLFFSSGCSFNGGINKYQSHMVRNLYSLYCEVNIKPIADEDIAFSPSLEELFQLWHAVGFDSHSD